MHLVVKRFFDKKEKCEMYRVVLRSSSLDLASRPTKSLDAAMTHAKDLCRVLGLDSYELGGKNIAVPKAA